MAPLRRVNRLLQILQATFNGRARRSTEGRLQTPEPLKPADVPQAPARQALEGQSPRNAPERFSFSRGKHAPIGGDSTAVEGQSPTRPVCLCIGDRVCVMDRVYYGPCAALCELRTVCRTRFHISGMTDLCHVGLVPCGAYQTGSANLRVCVFPRPSSHVRLPRSASS